MIELLQQSTLLATTCAGVLGLLVGSFLNVVIHRLPRMLEREWAAQAAELRGEPPPESPRFDLLVPRSRCPSCGHAITALENIPLLSWVVLRGRCSACGTAIGMRYPAVEVASALLSGLAVWHHGASLAGASALLLTWALIALAMIDLDTQLLPDDLTLPLLWLGLAFNLGDTWTSLPSAVIGAIAGYLSLWSVYWAFRLATGKEGMGYGDFKLLAALGAWFGWQALPGIILLSSIVGATVGIGLILLARHGREVPIPFGPYLAGAGLLTLYFGKPIAAYLGLV
jgi:leader peptidase (prepilin peptidase)/N-methyltransferase